MGGVEADRPPIAERQIAVQLCDFHPTAFLQASFMRKSPFSKPKGVEVCTGLLRTRAAGLERQDSSGGGLECGQLRRSPALSAELFQLLDYTRFDLRLCEWFAHNLVFFQTEESGS